MLTIHALNTPNSPLRLVKCDFWLSRSAPPAVWSSACFATCLWTPIRRTLLCPTLGAQKWQARQFMSMVSRLVLDRIFTTSWLLWLSRNSLARASLLTPFVSTNPTFRERESQVSLMRDIYRGASRVIAWLGAVPIESNVLDEVDFVKLLAVRKILDHRADTSTSGAYDIKKMLRDYEDQELQCYSRDLWKALKMRNSLGILARRIGDTQWKTSRTPTELQDMKSRVDTLCYVGWGRYYESLFWERLWIVQELILAANLTIQTGEIGMEPEAFLAGIPKDLTTYEGGRELSTIFSVAFGNGFIRRQITIYDLIAHRAEWHSRLCDGAPVKLYEVLPRFCHQESSEPLDKVFGLLGLAESCVKPDYSLAPFELYMYVLIEGVLELKRASLVRGEISALWIFCHACVTAFRFPASHPTVAAINLRALELCGVSWHMRFCVLAYAVFCGMPWIDIDGYQQTWRVRGILALIFGALLATLQAPMTFGSTWLQIQHLRAFNSYMTSPSGETRQFNEWMQLVDDNLALVKLKWTPRPRA